MFLTMQQQDQLVNQSLAKKKVNTELGLVTYKYAKKAMYKYLWNDHPELLECRGHTYDLITGELVVAAPRKSFNYLENGAFANKPLSTKVKLYKKFNGFMACVSNHNGRVIVSTTGSTSGPYVEMAKEKIFQTWPKYNISTWGTNGTWLFEICHENDLHIVDEKPGAYYLGYRSKVESKDYFTGQFKPTPCVADLNYDAMTLEKAIEVANSVKHEGFMCYDIETMEVCKLKSPYYTGKKKLMRMKDSNIDAMFDDPYKYIRTNLPESWMWFADIVTDYLSIDSWKAMTEQERRTYIEEMEKVQ